MPMYEYQCEVHGRFQIEQRANQALCPGIMLEGYVMESCDLWAKRKWGFQLTPVMQEHFNTTTGSYVSSRRQFADELKRKSAEADARSLEASLEFKRAADEQGIDIGDFNPEPIHHNFVPTEDDSQIGKTDEVKELARKRLVDSKVVDPKLYG